MTTTPTHGYTPHKELLLKRLARVEGQVRGIARMIEREEYCIDILQQTAALRTNVGRWQHGVLYSLPV